MIGIIVAMEKELQLLLEVMEEYKKMTINGFDFYCGSVAGVEAVAMTCGIGKVNAALGTLTLIDAFRPQAVINSGVAGGTGRAARILDVVLASAVAYHDVWCGPGTEWGAAAGCPRLFECPTDAGKLAEELGVKHGLVASGDIFVSRESDVERILELYPEAACVDMESGAVAQVCYLKGVAMYCVRVVSDTPGQADNISQYESFWSDAPLSTFHAVEKLVKRLSR